MPTHEHHVSLLKSREAGYVTHFLGRGYVLTGHLMTARPSRIVEALLRWTCGCHPLCCHFRWSLVSAGRQAHEP